MKSIGQIVGHYEILGQWAQGQGSSVYVARDLDARAPAAPRLYSIRQLADESTPKALRENILAEAHAASLLRHPRIIQIHEVITEDDACFVACDFVAGESLASLLRNVQGELSKNIAVAIAHQIATVLHEAHTGRDRRGAPLRAIHGDLSAASVIFTHEGDLFLADFGIQDATKDSPPGQLAYRAPERIAAQADIDPRADIHALGAVLFEMLTAEHPAAEMSDEALASVSFKPRIKATPALKRSGRDLETIVLRSTAPRRVERYETALDLADALDAHLRLRAPKLDLKEEIAKLMARHFVHRARATRTLVSRWRDQASKTAARAAATRRGSSASEPMDLRARPIALPLAEPLEVTETLVTDDVHKSADLSPRPFPLLYLGLGILLAIFAAIAIDVLFTVR